MDNGRIEQLRNEVLSKVQGHSRGDLEERVAALEKAVRSLKGEASTETTILVQKAHPSLRVLDVPGGTDRCIIEPDKPCTKSGLCRSFGH